MPLQMNSKTSRWYKKQLLARSDAEVVARLKEAGHRFSNKIASIDGVARHASITRQCNESGGTESIRATMPVLEALGFRPMGSGVAKLAHSTWKMVAGDDGQIECERLEAESVEVQKFPKRKKVASGDRVHGALQALGWPFAEIEQMAASRRAYILVKKQAYQTPHELVLRGLPAKVLDYDDFHFRVAFQGSDIIDLQPISKVADQDANSRLAALEEQAKALIVCGEFSRARRAQMDRELAEEELAPSDLEDFVAHCSSMLNQVLAERLSSKTAQIAGVWTEFNGHFVCDFSDSLHGAVEQVQSGPDVFQFSVYAEGQLRDLGNANSEQAAKDDCAEAAGFAPAPESFMGCRVLGPEDGKVTEELRDANGKLSHLNVEYSSGKQGRIALSHWGWDANEQALVDRHVS